MTDTATARVNVNVPTVLWERFEKVAKAHFRSRSDHLRFLMAQAVSDHSSSEDVFAVPVPRLTQLRDGVAAAGDSPSPGSTPDRSPSIPTEDEIAAAHAARIVQEIVRGEEQ